MGRSRRASSRSRLRKRSPGGGRSWRSHRRLSRRTYGAAGAAVEAGVDSPHKRTDINDQENEYTVSNWDALTQPIIEYIDEFVTLLYVTHRKDPSFGLSQEFERKFDVIFTVPHKHGGVISKCVSFILHVCSSYNDENSFLCSTNGSTTTRIEVFGRHMHDVLIRRTDANRNIIDGPWNHLYVESEEHKPYTPDEILSVYMSELKENRGLFSDSFYKRL